MISSAPHDPQNSHHFVVSSFHLAVVLEKVLWTVLWMVLWRELVMEPAMELETEPVRELFLSTFWTLLSMPHRHDLLLVARVPAWVLAMVPPKAPSASPFQADKSTSAYRSQSQRLADRPTLAASLAYLALSAPLFDARVFSDQSRAGAVFSLPFPYQQSSSWSTAGKRQPRQ